MEFSNEISPAVFADENMLTTVLRNLIHNSIKFSHKSSTVKINTYKRDDFLVTCVEDQGIGISEKELSKLFALDSQLRKVGTSNEQGTGLGLILCKEFVEKIGGEIWAESQKDMGFKISFTLPLYIENDPTK